MFKTIKSWFKVQPLVAVQQQEDIDRMVGEPVLSFVKCLKKNPKRFKLNLHSRQHVDSTDNWPIRYHWMSSDGFTGYYSLQDRIDGSMYYAILHKGSIYSINGINFSLNGWEMKYIGKAFFTFRQDSRKRKEKMEECVWDGIRKKEAVKESMERMLLKDKFV